MMSRLVVISITLVTLAIPSFIPASAIPAEPSKAEAMKNMIKARCARQWPGDYSMQLYCFNNQRDAVAQFLTLLGQYQEGTPEDNILVRCFAEWTEDDNIHDFVMIVYCAKNQLQHYRALQQQ